MDVIGFNNLYFKRETNVQQKKRAKQCH